MKVMFTVLIFGQTRIVTFTVLGHFRSSYKVIFGHLYSIMLTILDTVYILYNRHKKIEIMLVRSAWTGPTASLAPSLRSSTRKKLSGTEFRRTPYKITDQAFLIYVMGSMVAVNRTTSAPNSVLRYNVDKGQSSVPEFNI